MSAPRFKVGDRFDMLVIEERVGTKHGRPLWRFRCDCGRTVERIHNFLYKKARHSCGCLGCSRRGQPGKPLTHGQTYTASYVVWCSVKQRCHNPNSRPYRNYGGRGIYVCDEWRNSFEAFAKWSEDNGYMPGLELDRIDNDGPYAPWNCRYVSKQENLKNRRSSRLVGIQDGYGLAVRTIRNWANGFYSKGTASLLLAVASDLEKHRDGLIDEIYEPGLQGGRKMPKAA